MKLAAPMKENPKLENCDSNDLSQGTVVDRKTLVALTFKVGRVCFLFVCTSRVYYSLIR